MARAGLKPSPKLMQNLCCSRETELAELSRLQAAVGNPVGTSVDPQVDPQAFETGLTEAQQKTLSFKNPVFSWFCGLLASPAGNRMGDEGLEPPTSSL